MKFTNKNRKILSIVLLCFLVLQQFTPLGQVFNFMDDTVQTAHADSSTSTNSNYATVTGKMSADGKSITWTAVFNSAGYYHGSGMYNYFTLGSGLGEPTNVTRNGTAVQLSSQSGYYYVNNGYSSGKFTYQFTTPITDTTKTNYTVTVEDANYSTIYGTATATVDNTLTSVTVNKVWQDAPATKPSVTFDLYANGSTTALKSYIMASGMTSYTFSGLAKYDASGNPINYTVKERPVTGYTQSAKQNSATEWTFTNSNNVGTVSAQKTWLNVPTGTTKPTPSFTLTNLTTGQTFTNYTYDAATGKVSFANIQKVDANGKPYAFEIKEDPVTGYYTTYAKTDVYGTKWNITNNYLGSSTTSCAIPMGVTSVTNSKFYPFESFKDGVTYIGFNIDVSGTWSVPDSAKAGDSFTLQLPKEINVQGGGQQFFLKTADGSIAGTGTIDRSTNKVTFTLSAYVDTHNNVGGSFTLTGLQAQYNSLPTPGTYNLVYSATYNNNSETCTRTFTNPTTIDYKNLDGTYYTQQFTEGIKAVYAETDTTITWKLTVQARDLYKYYGYAFNLSVTDIYDTYQTLKEYKVYKTTVYDNNGFDTTRMTQINPTSTTLTNGFRIPLAIDDTTDYVILVTTNKKGTPPSGLYSNSMQFSDGYVVNAVTEPNKTASGTGSVATGSVFLKKVDGKQAPISGTEFTLYNADMKTVKGTLTTNAQGAIEFQNVPMGLYYLKETKALTGYLLDSTIREVVVDENGIVTVNSNPNSSTSPAMSFNYTAANISKNINGGLTNYTTQTDTSFTFNIPVELPRDISSYNSFVVTDKLASQFDFVNGNNQIIVDGVYRNDIGTISYDAATRTVKLSITNFEALNGATRLTLRFDAKVNTTAVPNTAYTNTADLSFENGSGTTGSKTSNPVTVQVTENPSITLDKSTTATKLPAVNQTLPYSLKFTNTGNTVLNKVTLTDDKVDLSGKTVTIYSETGTVVSSTAVNGTITLQPKQYAVLNYNYTVKQSDVDAGKVINNAKVVATTPAGISLQQTDTETVTGTSTPAIDLEKTSNVTHVTKVGDVIQYTFKITNNGQVTLSNVILNDAKAGISNQVVASSLAVGQSTTYTKNYTVTQADLDRGQVYNTATVKGTSPSGQIVTDPGEVTVPVVQSPRIDLVKSADKTEFNKLGEEITYTFTIKNTGNVTLSKLTLTDDKLGLNQLSVTTNSLAPGETITYTKVYKVTQADLDNGSILNSAVVAGTSPNNQIVTDPGEVSVKSTAQPQIALIKSVNPTAYNKVGEVLNYTFEVTNTGPVTLNNISITDSMFEGGITLNKTTLAPGEKTTATASYTVTQNDIDKGKLTNVATVHGFSPDNTPVSATDDATADASVLPIITLEKTSDVNSVSEVGQVVNYQLVTQNTGNTNLYVIKLFDGLPGLYDQSYEKISRTGTSLQFDPNDETVGLAPGESLIMKAKYKATAEDFAIGKIYNEAKVEAITLLNVPVSDTDDNTVTANANPAIKLDKSSNIPAVKAVGDPIDYTLKATNTGNVDLKNVNLVDDKVDLSKATFTIYEADGTTAVEGVSTTNGQISLKPGQIVIAKVTYAATQADFDKGNVLNKATVSAKDPSDQPVNSSDENIITAPQTPVMSVEKTTTKVVDKSGNERTEKAYVEAGDQIYYELTFKNDGNQTITSIKFSDNNLNIVDQVIDLSGQPLLPGQTYNYKISKPYTVLQSDIDNKKVTNVVVATGMTPGGPTPEVTDNNDTPANGQPAINVVKQVVSISDKAGKTIEGGSFTQAGDQIKYKFVITNTGNTTINEVSIKDTKLSVDVTLDLTQAPHTPLAPGDSLTYEEELPNYTVTQSDVNAGQVANTVSVMTPEITDPVKDSTITPGFQNPDLTVEKVSSVANSSGTNLNGSFKQAGDKISYIFKITNTGNTTINKVTLNDDKLGIKDQVVDLTIEPGETKEYTVETPYSVTQADVNAGKVVNTVSVSTPGDPTPATDENEVPGNSTTNISVKKNALKVTDANDKDLNGTFTQAGDKIYYEFVIKNTGDKTVNTLYINDPRLSITNLYVPLEKPLNPGDTYTHTLEMPYIITQDDVNNGFMTNVVIVNTPGLPQPVQDDETVEGNQNSSIVTKKTADKTSVTEIGQMINYEIVSTNTTLTNVKITDGLPGLYDKVLRIEDANGQIIQTGVVNGQITLLPGQRVVKNAKYKVTATDFAKGSIVNTTTTAGNTPTGDPVKSNESTVTVTADAKPAITMDKTSNVDNYSKVGDVISYTLTAKNTGNVDLTHVEIKDNKVNLANAQFTILNADGSLLTNSGITNGQVQLTVGQSLIAEVDYVITQADIDEGQFLNTGTATGNPPTGDPVSSNDTNEINTNRKPAMEVHKSVTEVLDPNGNPYTSTTYKAVGDQIKYAYEFTNTGNVTITEITFTDELLNLKDRVFKLDTPLAPGASFTYQVPETYTIQQKDIDFGSVTNVVTATGTTPAGKTPETTSDITVTADGQPNIDIQKDEYSVANFAGVPYPENIFQAVGDIITYKFVVTNIGNTTINQITVSDPVIGIDNMVIDLETPLAPGDKIEHIAKDHPHVVTQADIDAGSVHNAVTVSTPGDSTPPSDSTDTPGLQNVDINLVKRTTKVTDDAGNDLSMKFSKPGDRIYYEFDITNTGNSTIKEVTINDEKLGIKDQRVVLEKPLAPGATMTYPVELPYVVTQADVNAGKVLNTVTVSTPGDDTPESSNNETPGNQNPAVSVDKQTLRVTDKDGNDLNGTFKNIGDKIYYAFTIKNEGNTTINDFFITDNRLGIRDMNVKLDTPLEPGKTYTYKPNQFYEVVQADIDSAKVLNNVSVRIPGGDLPGTDTNETPGSKEPAVKIEKKTAKVVDAQGQDLSGTFKQAGDKIYYQFTLTNTGNSTIYYVQVTDTKLGLDHVVLPLPQPLAPGATYTHIATTPYTVTQADVDAGQVLNTVTISTPGNPTPVTSDNTTPGSQTPDVSVTKKVVKVVSATSGQTITNYQAIGDEIFYAFDIVNTGNTTINQVTITDALLNVNDVKVDLPTPIKPGETYTYSVNEPYKVTQADINKGQVDNTVTVTTPNDSTPGKDDHTQPGTLDPKLELMKTSDKNSVSQVGEEIQYILEAVNTGNSTLTNVKIEDNLTGLSNKVYTVLDAQNQEILATSDNGNVKLEPGQKLRLTATYKATAEDFAKGKVYNLATTSGQDPKGTPVSDKDDNTVDALGKPGITLEKTSDKPIVSAVDELITYTLIAENTGNVTLTDVMITDDKVKLDTAKFSIEGQDLPSGVTNGSITLEPGQKLTAIVEYKVTQADVNNGQIINNASIKGTPPVGDPVDASATNTVNVDQTPAMTVVKTAESVRDANGQVYSTNTYQAVGDKIYYSFTFTNTGNVTLNKITFSDELLGLKGQVIDLKDSPLEPGESSKYSTDLVYTVTQADLDKGTVKNIVTATGTTPGTTDNPGKTTPEVPAEVITPAEGKPAVIIEKETVEVKSGDTVLTDNQFRKVRDTIRYRFTITNVGNVTLNEITVTDDKLDISETIMIAGGLAPGGTYTFNPTQTYAVTQTDVDAGQVINKASVTTPGNDTPSTDENITNGHVEPLIELVKSADKTSVSSLDEEVVYTFTVKNTGNVTLKDVKVTDPMFPEGITLKKTDLTPGETTTGTSKYTATQADIDAGNIHNVATATGTPPGSSAPPTATSQVDVPVDRKASLDLVKRAENSTTARSVGDKITYNFTVENTGNVTIDNILVNDQLMNLNIELDKTSLAPGEKATGTATYTVTQTDVDAGKVVNTATVTGTPPEGVVPPTDEATVEVPTDVNPAMTLDKTSDTAEFIKAGDVITYTFTVKNTGKVTLKDVLVSDPLLNDLGLVVALDKTILAPGEEATATAQYLVTQSDVDAGKVVNTATLTANTPSGTPVGPVTDNHEVPGKSTSSIKLDKVSSTANYSQVGDLIDYQFEVTNTGDVTLTDVKVTDSMFPDGIKLKKTTLAPGESTSGTAQYKVTQDDLNKGNVENAATATGTPPNRITPPSSDDKVVVPSVESPGIALEKTSSTKDFAKADDVITYDFKVTNTGNVTLKGIQITDEKIKTPVKLESTMLNPGESTTGTAQYTVTQADVDAGKVYNIASVTGTPPGDSVPPTATDDHEITSRSKPSIALSKSADLKEFTKAGDKIQYTFTVRNTGHITLSDVIVNDPMLANVGTTITLDKTVLAPGESSIGTAEYIVTQADVDAGKVYNAATATGIPPGTTEPPISEPAEVTVPGKGQPAIELTKLANSEKFINAGDIVTYTFEVKNIGDVTLTDVKVTDPMLKDNYPEIKLDKTSLAPNEVAIGTALYKVTQADVDKGLITNTATAEGTPPEDGNPETPNEPVKDDSTVMIKNVPTAAIELEKLADREAFANVGEVVTYTFKVTNKGNVTLTDVKVSDDKLNAAIVLNKTTLAPGEEAIGTATYVVTQADMNAGKIYNKATATGTPPKDSNTPNLTPPTDDDDVTITNKPMTSITIDKSADKVAFTKAGEEITYSFLVTNTGNVTLTDVKVDDPMLNDLGITIELDHTTLEPGEVARGTAKYVTTQKDVDAGRIYNRAITTGTPPENMIPPIAEDVVEVTNDAVPSILLDKEADRTAFAQAGEVVTYSFKVTNNGSVTLTDVKITDPMFDKLGISLVLDQTTLAPGESTTAKAQYTITQADMDRGKVINNAIATGTPPDDNDPKTDPLPNPTSEDSVVITNQPTSTIDLVKLVDRIAFAEVGEVLTYTFKVTNTGNVTLTDVTVDDPMIDGEIILDQPTLKPGESTTGTAKYTVTQADMDAGRIYNKATATGTPPDDGDPKTPEIVPPTDTDSVIIKNNLNPSIKLVKEADLKAFAKVGDIVTYTFTMTNNGNVTLTDVKVDDPMLNALGTDIVLGKTTLAPGETIIGTAKYVVTQADMDAGKVDNIATATGTPPDDNDPDTPSNPPTSESKVTITNTPTTEIDLVKEANQVAYAKVGEEITYTFTVTNRGNVTLTDVKVDDPMLENLGTKIQLLKTELAPGESTTGTAKYTITQADIDRGKVYNHAVATGTPPDDNNPDTPSLNPPTDEDKVVITNELTPKIDLVKQVDRAAFEKVGDEITYTFTVTNVGNVTLDNVVVTDPLIDAPIVLDKTKLLPGESTTGTAKYTITQEDMNRGKVYNRAIATGTPPDDGDPNTPPLTPPTDDGEVTITNHPTTAIQLDKEADKTVYIQEGEEITYTFTVTNIGNVILKDVNVTDPLISGPINLAKTELAPGESTTGSAIYQVSKADVEAGRVYNQARATGTPPIGMIAPIDDDDAIVNYQPDVTTIEPETSEESTTTVEPEISVEETTVEPETSAEETTEIPVLPVDPSGDITLYKKETGKDIYLDGAVFDLIQKTKYIDFELKDQTKAQNFHKLPIDILKDNQLVKENLEVKANVQELVDYEVTEEGKYTLRFEEYDHIDITYEVNADQTGFIITVKDIEENSSIESSQTSTTQETTGNQALIEQITKLQAQIDTLRANTPVLIESTEMIPGQPIIISPESTNEDGTINPAVTSVEMLPNVVSSNQAEIDAHNAQIADLEAQLASLQAQTTESNSTITTIETSQAEVSAETSQQTVSELPYLTMQLNTKVDQYTTEKGHIAIEDLRKGQYYFIEVEAPKGYIADKATKHDFEITGNETETIVKTVNNDPEKTTETTVETTEETKTTIESSDSTNETTQKTPNIEETTTKPGGGGSPGGGGGGGDLPSTGENSSNIILLGMSLIIISMATVILPQTRKYSDK